MLVADAKARPMPPTTALVQSYVQKWDTLEKYVFQEASLALLFQRLCPRNSEMAHVLLKVSALNDFYSTNIYDTHTVARHIVTLNVDERITRGDLSLVNQMALVAVGWNKNRNFYSFASKYCNHHNPDAFPIFDSYVEKMLLHFRKRDQFSKFRASELKQYSRFVEIIRVFQKHYSLARARSFDIGARR
jgi:hypothetical protein